MKRRLDSGYELDDDPGRIDRDLVHRFLSVESYWAKGRSRKDVETTLRNASRLIGAYVPDGEMVGFCRISSDEVVYAYLCDVFVLEAHRGHGLGRELMVEAVENGPHVDLRFLLGTVTAHDFYRQFGFREPSTRIMERPGPNFPDPLDEP